jgi:hypothetical protein
MLGELSHFYGDTEILSVHRLFTLSKTDNRFMRKLHRSYNMIAVLSTIAFDFLWLDGLSHVQVIVWRRLRMKIVVVCI